MTYTLLTEWENEAKSTRRILERIPEEHFSWKPHERSTSLGELAMHISSLPHFADAIIMQEELDFNGEKRAPPKDKAEVLARFDAMDRRMVELLQMQVDMNATWSFRVKGHTVFSGPRGMVIRSFLFSHLIHHRGQLSVYLRLLDVPVPGLYGPSADEQ